MIAHRNRLTALAVVALVAATGLTACSNGGGGSTSSSPIKIGASIPLTGGLAGFGAYLKWGYQHSVDVVNAKGGITVDGVKKKIKLILLDDKTDANTTVNNVNTLITADNVDALLGSCTDSLVEPGALVANRKGVPMVTGCAATNTFGPTTKWKWAWDLFFNSDQLTETPFKAVEELKLDTNKKVAIIHSNGPNEQVMGGQEWPKWAKKYGWMVTENVSLPPDTTQFTTAVAAAKAAGADMVLAVFPPPSAIALRKQMATADYTPKLLSIEEGGEPAAFADALGDLANGVMVGGYWAPTFPYPGASDIAKQFEKETGKVASQHIADSSTAAAILLDAIAKAGSLDKTKINNAIAKTDKTYVVGPIKFGADHTSTLPMVETQWQDAKTVVVAPKDRANATVLFPMP